MTPTPSRRAWSTTQTAAQGPARLCSGSPRVRRLCSPPIGPCTTCVVRASNDTSPPMLVSVKEHKGRGFVQSADVLRDMCMCTSWHSWQKDAHVDGLVLPVMCGHPAERVWPIEACTGLLN